MEIKSYEIKEVNPNEIDALIEGEYNLEYDILDSYFLDDWTNGSCIMIEPMFPDNPKWDETKWENWKESGDWNAFLAPMIFGDLINKGVLENGIYIVNPN